MSAGGTALTGAAAATATTGAITASGFTGGLIAGAAGSLAGQAAGIAWVN